jgi:hypothetical protein
MARALKRRVQARAALARLRTSGALAWWYACYFRSEGGVVVSWFMTVYATFAVEQLANAIRISGHYPQVPWCQQHVSHEMK